MYSIEYLTTEIELVWTVHKIMEYLTLGLLCSLGNIYSTTAYFLTHPVQIIVHLNFHIPSMQTFVIADMLTVIATNMIQHNKNGVLQKLFVKSASLTFHVRVYETCLILLWPANHDPLQPFYILLPHISKMTYFVSGGT